MSVETAEDLAAFFDADEHAVTATISTSGGDLVVDGILDAPVEPADVVPGISVDSRSHLFTCREVDIVGAKRNDPVSIPGFASLKIRFIRPDGTGVADIVLQDA